MDDPTTKESADDNEENAIDSKSGSLRHGRGSAPDPYPHELVPGQDTAAASYLFKIALISRKILESTGRGEVYLRNLTLERFLNSVEVGPDAITAEVEMPLDIDEEQESSVDGDDQDRLDLVDLKNARSYFTSGTSLAQFQAKFRDFLHLPRMVVEEARTQTQRQTDTEPGRGGNAKSYEWFYSVGFWQSKLTSWLYDAVYPPKPGYQRVRYICTSKSSSQVECSDFGSALSKMDLPGSSPPTI
ncbi:hypothetical protein CCUS01_14273 [Colletotrichum cuscutae]|uniref:Uncharacterized protein n=1 Tax=Colletotrichum cuscutae TaxID=1209917 RepID=A0AAJ0DL86_9PEZI|nr:hypothetical protein CCUS01_14273 [Colletotrichum cuscutae]